MNTATYSLVGVAGSWGGGSRLTGNVAPLVDMLSEAIDASSITSNLNWVGCLLQQLWVEHWGW